jgi:hypothetical protein
MHNIYVLSILTLQLTDEIFLGVHVSRWLALVRLLGACPAENTWQSQTEVSDGEERGPPVEVRYYGYNEIWIFCANWNITLPMQIQVPDHPLQILHRPQYHYNHRRNPTNATPCTHQRGASSALPAGPRCCRAPRRS